MAETNEEIKRSPFVERVPELTGAKWGGMPREEARRLVDDILKDGKVAVGGVLAGLREVDDGSDWKERLLVHMLVTQTSVPEREKEQALVGAVMLETLEEDRPAPVKAFLVQQLRLFADEAALPRLAPLLEDGDAALVDAVCATMVSIGPGARESLRAALAKAGEQGRKAIEHALDQLS